MNSLIQDVRLLLVGKGKLPPTPAMIGIPLPINMIADELAIDEG